MKKWYLIILFFIGCVISKMMETLIPYFYVIYIFSVGIYVFLIRHLPIMDTIERRYNYWRIKRYHHKLQDMLDAETNYRIKRQLFGEEKKMAATRRKLHYNLISKT